MGQKLSTPRRRSPRALTYLPPEPVSPPRESASVSSQPRPASPPTTQAAMSSTASPPASPGRQSKPASPRGSQGSAPASPMSKSPRRSFVSKLFGGSMSNRPSLTLREDEELRYEEEDAMDGTLVPQPIAQVPMQRCSVTTHLRPSFVTALLPTRPSEEKAKLGRRRSTAAMLLQGGAPPPPPPPPAPVAQAVPAPSSPLGAASSISSPVGSVSSGSSASLSDDELSVEEFNSSSSDEELIGDEELEVNDWLDEPEDAVLTPKSSNTSNGTHRRGRSFSSASSSSTTRTRGPGPSHSMSGSILSSKDRPSLPAMNPSTSNSVSSLSAWLSGQDEQDDELDDDYEPVLTDFMRENMPVYEVMKQVQLFRNLSQKQQEQVLRALKPAKFQNGEIIVQQGTRGSRFYMIAKGEAVVTKKIEDDDQERMVTHLHPGHYFGELALIYDDPRTATVRAEGDVELLYLTQEDFQRIGQVHLSLMLQQVPLLAQLSARDQDAVLGRLQPANFNDGEYIVRQGDQGTRFYMITRGEAVVSEKDTRPGALPNQERELTRLYEGHVFGEMALIYSEPRTASVRAIGPVKCLYLTKEDFDKCLLSERFHKFIQHAYVEKATRRAMRLKVQQRAEKEGGATPMTMATPGMQRNTSGGPGGSGIVLPPPAPSSPVRATETKKLVRRLKDGQKVVNKYVIKGDLGKGTFGRVKLCQSEEDKKLYAVKIMHKTFVQRMAGKEDQLQDVLRREVAIMKKLNHRNVVKLVEVIDDPSSQKMYLVQEYVQHNLMDEVKRARGLSEEVARKYTRDLLSGLHYLHYHKVIHRDIKPENILVSAEGVAKIADFGTARMIMNESETISGAKGTPAFMAPEMFDVDATYSGPSVDVWSLGATLYMMVIGVPPWLADNEILLAEKVQHDELTFPADVERTMEPHLKNLLQRMLTKNPKLRISLNECFTHDWITKEGSEPLVGFGAQPNEGNEELMTVSIDESERAIQNIPERIDLSLSEFLEQAHLLVKTRQQTGGSNNSMHRTGSGQSWPSGASTPQERPASNSLTSDNRQASSSSSSPSRTSAEENSRIIRAWRHHKRVQLMYGHKDLSERSRELLLEQKRIAFSADRAKVEEIILPTMGPSTGSAANRARYQSSSAAQLQQQVSAGSPLSPRDRHSSSPDVLVTKPPTTGVHPSQATDAASTSSSSYSTVMSKKSSFGALLDEQNASGGGDGMGSMGMGKPRTSFTSVSGLSDLMGVSMSSMDDSIADSMSVRSIPSDADLMKRPLSRKKDFLMVTSEVFRDQEGDFQSRKILFQARDHDFSVASRVPAHSKSGRNLGRNSSSQLKKNGSRRSLTSSYSVGSVGSAGSSQSSNKLGVGSSGVGSGSELDLDGLDCVQVADEGEEEEEDDGVEMEGVEEGDEHEENSDSDDEHSSSDGSEGSIYSDVEGDVDVDETFNDLIGSSNHCELETDDDDEIAPMVHEEPLDPALLLLSPASDSKRIVQVYVSSKIRENLKLSIRSGYAEAKGSRSYMEDKTTGVTACSLEGYDEVTRQQLAETYPSLAYFAVYDGHNGDDTAKFLQAELHHRFFQHPQFVSDPVTAISLVCETVDTEILDKQNRSVATPKRKRMDDDVAGDDEASRYAKTPRDNQEDEEEECELAKAKAHASGSLQPISFSGAAAVLTVVATRWTAKREALEKVMYIANIGDCRAVLCTAHGMAVDLTKDHKASQDEEKKRIEASGGFVHNGRLDGILALSRGFGDLAHKTDGHLVATPDVYERVVGPEDEFVLMASDGLFDVLSSQQAVNFIYRKLRLHGDVQLAAQEMVLKAQQYYAHDNISVVIVALNQTADDSASLNGAVSV